MLCHLVLAMRRANLSEAVVAISPTEAEARKSSRQVATAMSGEFVRCRVRQMTLTRSDIEVICFACGRQDALAGEPLLAHRLPRPYAAAYRHGYRVGKQSARRADDA